MGTEMIAKATDSFQRKQRKSLEQLEEPSLFTCAPHLTYALVATPDVGYPFTVGDEYRLVLTDQGLLVVDGVSPVGRVEAPPNSVLDMMRGPSPSARGCIKSVSSLTGQAELLLE